MANKNFEVITINSVYGKWTVVGGPTEGSPAHCKWWCRCACGNYRWVNANSMVRGISTQCLGCSGYAARTPMFVHLPRNLFERIKSIAKSAIRRCVNPADKAYRNYGKRGIKCNFTSWQSLTKYLLTLSGHDDQTLVLDRIDNDKHYQVGNLRFVTHTKSNLNRRLVGEVRYFTNHGFDRPMRQLRNSGITISEIARLYCTQRHTVREVLA